MDTAARGRSTTTHRARAALLGLLLAALLCACRATAPAATTAFYNPLNPLDGADPWLQFYDGNYYLTATQWSAIRMWKSPTIAGLASAAPTTIWSDSTPSRCCNVWAPEFHLLEGPDGPRWYVYYTAGTDGTLDNQRMHALESSGADPLGPYTYKGRIFDPTNDGWAIDGSVLKMPDGALYYLFSAWEGPNQNIFIAPMSNPWTIIGGRVRISTATYDWEKSLANVNEGPEALQHNGKIFIIYSASACWGPDYKLGMLTYSGGDVLSAGSWAKHPEPVFARSDANGVYGPGHNGFFTSPDGSESWIVYHANSAEKDGCTGERTTRVQKFAWNDDGTPNFGVPLSLDTAVTPPSGERGAAPPPAASVYYTLVNKDGGACLGVAAGAAPAQPLPCDDGARQQWRLEYLGNSYYRLVNRDSGQALEAAGGPGATEDGAQIRQSGWAHGPNQQWRLLPASGGWLRIEARHSGKVIDSGGCGAGGSIQQNTLRNDSGCQQWRLQPIGDLKIVNANSGRLLAVDNDSTADGANVVLWSDAATGGQRWRFAHQDDGFYQIVASHSDKCLDVAGDPATDGANVAQQGCGDTSRQWRIEPLNDGMLRLVARDSGKVIDVSNCRMGDGTNIQQWSWLDNMCQRFRFAAP